MKEHVRFSVSTRQIAFIFGKLLKCHDGRYDLYMPMSINSAGE